MATPTPQLSKHWFCRTCRKYLFVTFPGDPLPERDELYCTLHRLGGDGRSRPRGYDVVEAEGISATTPNHAVTIVQKVAALKPNGAPKRRGRRPNVANETKAYPAVPAAEDKADVKPGKRRMGVTKVTQFRALDGSMHDTWQAATKHNTDNALTQWLDDWLCENMAHGELLASAADLAKALRKDWMIARKKDPAV